MLDDSTLPADPQIDAHDEAPSRAQRLWMPRQVLLTRSARQWAHGQAMAERVSKLGLRLVELPSDRLTGWAGDDPSRAYADAKSTLAIVVAPPAKRRLQPIPPSADWRFDLAVGCPAHCQYCYLAGSLAGPPMTRAYANLPEILDGLPAYLGQGKVTSRSRERMGEGTTYEASCYTDPLGIEHLTGSLAETIKFFGAWQAETQLRFTTKFSAVDELLGLQHGKQTHIRMSVTAPSLIRFEGGTAPLNARLDALRRMGLAGYRLGLTVAPIMANDGWEEGYATLFDMAAERMGNIPNLDLTVELITHRFTPKSKDVLTGWYPATRLDMDESRRSVKTTKFGSTKYVYPTTTMKSLRATLEGFVRAKLPNARLLYWT